MSPAPERAPGDGAALPALVLRCRLAWRVACGLAAVALLALGSAALTGAVSDSARPWVAALAAPLLLLSGSGCAYFVARYCLARLVLDDRGFRLEGPLDRSDVPWASVVRWEHRRPPGGPACVRVVHGPERRRLTIPLIYEDGHLLELGLGQRRFPRY